MGARENSIIRRITRQAGIAGLAEALASKLPLSDLQSLLMHIYQQRASKLRAADLLWKYQENRFTRIAQVSPEESAKFDGLAYELLPQGFEPVELSPVAPIGSSSVLGPVHQNNVVTTIRNTEVISDPTNVMAMECALRRKAHDSSKEVKLCCSQRLLRAQVFSGPVSFPHFRVLSLCSAGRDSGSCTFEVESMVEHIDFYLRLIAAAETIGYQTKSIRLLMIAYSERMLTVIDDRIREEISKVHPGLPVEIELKKTGAGGYYSGMRFHLFAGTDEKQELLIVDGGHTDWTQKLLQNRKERLMTSGMGTERFFVSFRRMSGMQTETRQYSLPGGLNGQ